MTLAEYIRETGINAAAFGRSVGVGNRQTMFKYMRKQRPVPLDVALRIVERTEGKVTLLDVWPDAERVLSAVA